MSKINALCVYCGSSPGTDPAFAAAARAFGKILAENGVRLIYGGGSVGMMGTLAEAVLEHGGEATGIIPDFLTRRGAPEQNGAGQIVIPDMHERKRNMFESRRRLRGAAGRHRHAGGTGRAAHLGAARPSQEADPDRQHQRLLGPAARADRAHAGREFVPPALNIDFSLPSDVEDILPKLREAAQGVRRSEKAMAVPLERM